jgi:two-component system chemotaxis sensor kinase CheA
MSDKFQIVLIDDETNILDLYQSFIPEDRFDMAKFTDPEEAVNYIIENHSTIALVISDFKMPKLTGFDVRKKILDNDLDIPFAMVTGFYDKEMATEGMKLRISRFIEKPIEESVITELLNGEAQERIESINEDREMISEFLQETQPMLEEIEELILSLEDDPHDTKAVNTYFRLLHTIKGTSSCLGLNVISGYAHKYEDLITSVKEHKINVNRKVIDVLLVGLDQLKELYSLAENFKPFPADIEERANVFDQDFSKEDATPGVQAKEGEVVQEDPSAKKEKAKEEKVTVSENLLAHFLEMSGELTVIRNSIFKSLARVQEKCQGDKDVEHLVEGMGEMQKVSGILQNQISEMKKVSIETVYRPMRRVVRDSCAVLDKQIDFEIQGEDLKIDTTVAKLLNGALVHLLRNGVDHGIESGAEREKAGKNPEGKLILNSYQTGEDIIVEIIDDGKGLNKDILKKKALEKGLFTEKQLSTMSDQKIYSIIFESGFSTNTEVTSVSGRGVGMDMVRSSIEEFGGKILIDSEVGRGTKFILVIPIPRSILIIKSLMVSCEENKFNIPLDDVDEVVLYDKSKKEQQIYKNNGGVVLKHHNILCPLVSLGTTLGLTDKIESEFDMQNIVIVKGEGFRYGILVDAIEDIEEIVVKKLSSHFSIQEYLGTTFADDGALSLILDCKGIAKRYGIENLTEDESNNFLINKSVAEEVNEFMRFSLESIPNCALPLEWVFRLEEIQTKQIQFTGSTAVVRYRGKSLPLLHIEHLLGMTETTLEDIAKEDHVLSVLVVRLENKLFGAIIKELHDIAVSNTGVETEFSDREGLMGTVTIDEKIISVIDIEALASHKIGTLKFSNMDFSGDRENGVKEEAA